MKTHKKRLLSLLLLVCMICTMQAGMSFTAFAVGETFTPSGTRQDISPTVTFDKDGFATITNVPVIPDGYTLMYVVDFGDCGDFTNIDAMGETCTPLSDDDDYSLWYIDDGNYTARDIYSEGSKIDISSGHKSLLLTVVRYEVYPGIPGNQYYIYGAYLCAIPQKITYNLNGGNIGGDITAKTEYLLNGDTLATTFNAPTKDGYLFKGWYTAGTGGSKVTSATTSSATYYAQWEDKLPINNTAGTATVAYAGTEIDLTAVSGLFTVDAGAGAQTFTIEGGTGAGTISDNLLTVTEAGTIEIGLRTAETATHQAGAKITAMITVNKGAQNAPTGLGKTDAGSYGGSDGKITGLTPNRLYEYKKDGGAYTAVTADTSGEITGLSAGSYVVRFAGNDLYDAGSDSPEIIIGQAAPPSSAKDVSGATSPANATINGTAITVSVANSVTSQPVSLTVSADATWNLYSDAACTQENAAKIMSLSVGANTAYVKVTAADGTTQVYLLTITRASSSSNKSSSGSGGSKIIPSSLPAATVTGTAQNKATMDGQGNASTTVTDKNITDAIANAKAEAAKKGVSAGDITVSINISTSSNDANMITVNLPMTTQQQVISNKLAGVELAIDRPDIVIGLNNAAITEINRQANADVQLTATRTDSTKLSTAAKNAIGSRPAYDFKASYQGGKGSVTDFGKGSVYVSIPYTPAKNEKTGYLYAAYVDSNGKVIRVPGSAYNANTKSLHFTTNHFSVYGIGYADPTAQFTDVSSHWAKDSIDYVVGRGLLNGISETAFSPNTAMTRGMLVTVLGRLADADTKAYTANSFTDVKAASALRPYIEWAYKKGIIQGIGSQQFAPDRAVTREEIAVILVNYTKTTGYTLPKIREATAYADAASISSTYKAAVSSLQQAGIMVGGADNKFNPKSSATRGEVSTMLHNYIKLTVGL